MSDGNVTFTAIVPSEAQSRANIAVNERRRLPEAVPLRTVVIVANGPSARDKALWQRLKRRPDTVTVALNGVLKLFNEHGVAPTYWAACDPQPAVLDFLMGELPVRTNYLVATKCDPAVFDRLKGRAVQKWRLDDYGREPGKISTPCAVSITLVTQALFREMGFHRFEMYGWDCCYLDGEHHGSEHAADMTGLMTDETVELRNQSGEVVKSFASTTAWMCECNDAATQAANFKALGLEMIVHGPGLVGAILRGRGLI